MTRFLFCISILGMFGTVTRAQVVTITNVPNQHYRYTYFPGDCPSGYDIPPGQWPPTNHIEGGRAIYNDASGQWVFWAHYDNSSYTLAQVLVAASPNECGPYTVQTEFQPEGYQSRDENIFQDDDGSAYLISASNRYGSANDTMAIFKMTADYRGIDTSVPPTWVFDHQFREAPAVAKTGGTYFLVTSQAAGWFPSQGGYAASSAMLSGWSALRNLGNTSTFGSQSAQIVAINGTEAATFVLILNHLGGNLFRDTGSIWLPLILDGAAQTATLDWYTSWQVDMTTGVLTLPSIVNLAASGTASATSSAPSNPPSLADDGVYTTRWQAATSSFPASWTVDLGSPQPIQEVNLSWYMVKGSEPYYNYTIGYSLDGTNYTTLDHTDNIAYGFTNDSVNFTARYVQITETGYVCQNGCTFYSPSLMEAQIVQAPLSQNLPVDVTVTPSATTVPVGETMTVTVTVDGGSTNPTPSGKVTLTGPSYISDTYGLLNGSATFTIVANAMNQGDDTITATYIPDPTSAPTYGVASTTGSSPVIAYGDTNSVDLPNFGFEAPVITTYIYNPAGASWTFTAQSGSNGSGISAKGSGFTSANAQAPQGGQVAFLQSSASITQTLSGFVSGATYTVTFSAAQRNRATQFGQTLDVQIDGATIGSFAPPQSDTSYQDYSATFTATADTHTVAFVGTNLNGGDNTIFLDNVRIAPAPPDISNLGSETSRQRIPREAQVLDNSSTDQVFLNDAFRLLRRHASVPCPFGIHDADRSVHADPQALALGAVARPVAAGDVELLHPPF